MTNIRNALMQAAGTAASGDPVYVEDVFSTHLYTGDAESFNTIINGIDLAGEGGLVWIKERSSGGGSHKLLSTDASGNHSGLLDSSSSNAAGTGYQPNYFFQNNNGFKTTSVVGDTTVQGNEYASWTFRIQEGFFDIQTASLDGSGNAQFTHDLGAAPGMVLVKPQNFSDDWYVYHKSTGTGKYLILNTTAAAATFNAWGNVSATTFDANIGFGSPSGKTVVAYFFADGDSSNAQIFGEDSDEAIIKTGTYTGTGNTSLSVNLGFEPQWLLIKASSGGNAGSQYWAIYDVMRGWGNVTGSTKYLAPNLSSAEATWWDLQPTSTGFASTADSGTRANESGTTYIYMAIRRGPMKEPEAGTDVYKALAYTGTSASSRHYDSALLTDMFFHNSRQSISGSAPPQQYPNTSARLFYKKGLATHNNNAQFSSVIEFDKQTGIELTGLESVYEDNGTTHIFHMFRRYPKVFDVVVYTGTGSSLNVAHNLNATPELIIVKKTTESSYAGWAVYYGTSSNLILNKDNATGHWYSNAVTAASSTTFTAAANTDVNDSTETHIAYLFASLDGISKVGTYTGTGNDLNVTGLGAAARFVLIKRTDSTGDWYIFDSTRGIVSGDDPYLLINSTGIEVTNTDYIDPHSSGFTITSSAPAALNTSGGTYLYLAFA